MNTYYLQWNFKYALIEIILREQIALIGTSFDWIFRGAWIDWNLDFDTAGSNLHFVEIDVIIGNNL